MKNFVESKISTDGLSDDILKKTVAEFYGSAGDYKYTWNNTSTKEQKCKIEICRKITEIEDISKVISYDILSINKNYNSDCYNDVNDRVTFDTGTTIMDYWEKVCLELLSEEAVM